VSELETEEPITEEQVAEANEPESEPENEPDDEPILEPEPEPVPASDMAGEKRAKASEREVKRYFTALGKIWEEQAVDLIPCPLCPDLHKGLVNKYDAGKVPEEITNAVQIFLGFAREQDYEPDPEVATCPTCKGRGFTKTGSQVTNNEKHTCKKCNGFGYFPPPVISGNGHAAVDVLHAPAGETLSPLDNPDVDLAGEPRVLPDGRMNPNFGLWPQYKVKVPPYGETAGLTAQDVA
jgi:hypothetical protein